MGLREVHEAAGILDWTPAVEDEAAGILDQSRRTSRKMIGDIGWGRRSYCIRPCGVVYVAAGDVGSGSRHIRQDGRGCWIKSRGLLDQTQGFRGY